MFTKPENWNKLSPLERRKLRLDYWQNTPVEFISPEAEANYKVRIDRLRKTYDMAYPDRFRDEEKINIPDSEAGSLMVTNHFSSRGKRLS